MGRAHGDAGGTAQTIEGLKKLAPERRFSSTVLLAAWIVLTGVVLGGCSASGSAPPGISAAVFSVVTGVWTLRHLGDDPLLRSKTSGDPVKDYITALGQHVKFFLRWRAEAHLATDSDTGRAIQAVAAEYDRVRADAATTVGLDSGAPSSLITGTDLVPPHLNLDDVLRATVDMAATSDGARRTEQL